MASKQGPSTVGRPRDRPAVELDTLEITLDAASPPGLKSTHFGSGDHQAALLALVIPHHLLYHWYNTGSSSYVQLVNSRIKQAVVQLRTCDRLEERLRDQAGKVHRTTRQSKGRKREGLLSKNYHLFVLEGEAENMGTLKEAVTRKDEELTQLLEDMAAKITEDQEAGHTSSQTQLNRGRPIEEVSPRQARRKLKQVTSLAKQSLWFAESFGLVPDFIHLHKTHSGSPVKLAIGSEMCDRASQKSIQPSSSDYEKLCQVLYVVDKFAISDEAYHELVTTSSLPPLHKVKGVRKALNTSIELERLSGPYPGAFRSPTEMLKMEISKAMTAHPEKHLATTSIMVKLSGDGARFSKSSNLLLLSFSLTGPCDNLLSGAGNHTFAAMVAEESYSSINTGFKEVTESINSLLENPAITVNDTTFQLEIILGGDYKFLLLMMGLNQAHSTYSCVWCNIHKEKRWDTSISYEEHTKDNIRTLGSIKHCAQLPKSKPTNVRLGVQNPPILNIEPDHVVADELHLLLRIGDVLLRNLVYEIVTTNRKTPSTPSLTDLQKAIHECGVTFRVWERRDTDGKSSGKYEWTSLMGTDIKTVLRLLPSKFQAILHSEDVRTLMAKIWEEFYQLYLTISSSQPPQSETVHTMAKNWLNLFLSLQDKCQSFQKNVTPYMHTLVYHVPQMIKKYGNIKMFSGQGVEKNNDDAKRNYFSNLHDAPGEILKAEGRMETTEEHKRLKRSYTKRDEYWVNGGLHETRKQQRLDISN